jgi:hypothetical protein
MVPASMGMPIELVFNVVNLSIRARDNLEIYRSPLLVVRRSKKVYSLYLTSNRQIESLVQYIRRGK